MFNSKGNNFGAGVIPFKDVQEDGYAVLNARFTCNPQCAEYKAAEVLEIYVPALSIERSADAGVVVRFRDRRQSAYGDYAYDSGTVARSWVRDAGTLCIEKLPVFDAEEELIVYIQALYCQLGRGTDVSGSRKKSLTAVTDGNYLTLDSGWSICVVFERWAFYHMMYRSCTYAMQGKDWEARLKYLPEDIDAEVPVISAGVSGHYDLGGVTETRLSEGFLTWPANERVNGFSSTGTNAFSFAYLVRDRGQEPEVEGRLRYAADRLTGTSYASFDDLRMELAPSPAVAAVSGEPIAGGRQTAAFPAEDLPEEIPGFEAFVLMTGPQYPCVLMLSLEVVPASGDGAGAAIVLTDLTGHNNPTGCLYDTAPAMAAAE